MEIPKQPSKLKNDFGNSFQGDSSYTIPPHFFLRPIGDSTMDLIRVKKLQTVDEAVQELWEMGEEASDENVKSILGSYVMVDENGETNIITISTDSRNIVY